MDHSTADLNLPVPSSRRAPARLALDLRDPASSGIIDVSCLRSEPMPWSLAPPGGSGSSEEEPDARPRGPSRSTLVAIVSALATGTAALAMTIALDTQPTIVVQDAPAIERTLSMQEVEAPKEHTTVEHSPDAAPPAAIVAAALEEEATAAKEATPPAKKKTARKSTNRSKSKSKSKSTSTRKSKASASIPVECVLDPSSCSAGSPNASGSTAPGGKAKATPTKLNATQLRTALASSKAHARTCGPEHGADAGTRVQVKISIKGDGGTVSSATALASHASTPLGACVARALSRTKFPSFTAPQMGMVYTVRL